MFYLGLSPELIDEWYLVLVSFNIVMSIVAMYFISLHLRRLKQNTDQDVIGSRFTWSFVKIIPVLVLLPVLSFYFFSFESIRDNLKNAEDNFDKFNLDVAGEVDELYKNTNDIAIKYYLDRSLNIAKLVNYFDAPRSSKMQMQRVLEQLALDNWAQLSKASCSNTLCICILDDRGASK